jgi:hypothetical protein
MRTITFYYEAVDNTGSLVKNSLTVPLLSIIPIPVIQIQEAQLDYAVGITLVEQDRTTGAMALKTAFRETATGTTASSNYHIKINMKVGPSDVPSGLSNLFKIMENNLVSQQNI